MDISNLIALIGLIFALITLLITILDKWNVISIGVRKGLALLRSRSVFNTTRRKILTLGLLSAGILMLGISRFIPERKNTKVSKWDQFKNVEELIVNKKTGVIHHKDLCIDHIPQHKTSVTNSITCRIHGSKKMQITSKLIGKIPDKLATDLLIENIVSSPTSTHLYKYLIKIWGKNKEYEKIHNFLKTNIEFLRHTLTISTNPKIVKKLTKALNELEVRKNKAEYLANIVKLKS